MNIICSKESIINHICKTSNEVADHFDKFYLKDIELLAEDIAISFNILNQIIDRPKETQVSDADFQSALLIWTAINTSIASIEIFRRGYLKEPPMLSRNILEIVGTAYDIHLHPEKLTLFRAGRYKSTESIGIVKKIHPIIGKTYGVLSEMFAHVNRLHSLPQGSYNSERKSIWIGGGFSESDKLIQTIILSDLTMTLDFINLVMEFIFYDEIKEHRFWTKVKDGVYKHLPIERIRKRGNAQMKEIQQFLKIIKI